MSISENQRAKQALPFDKASDSSSLQVPQQARCARKWFSERNVLAADGLRMKIQMRTQLAQFFLNHWTGELCEILSIDERVGLFISHGMIDIV
ncbi:hypothetical protein [Symmachiella macrocystis]|uniref:hypothetical protein n=1 Tax=Symmachiella macrocystis TaxID=2527985 RepID=UPI0011B6B15F|nr:hypothetical protein [Symmachiella macrocystis]